MNNRRRKIGKERRENRWPNKMIRFVRVMNHNAELLIDNNVNNKLAEFYCPKKNCTFIYIYSETKLKYFLHSRNLPEKKKIRINFFCKVDK